MGKAFGRLILLFIALVILKAVLAGFISAPSAPSDDYFYAKMAWSFFNYGTFSVHDVPTNQYPPLYPIMISISYLAEDMRVVFFLMKFINVILSSLIIFPAFFLAREFFDDKKSLVIALVVSVLPSNFSFSGFILAENLFYTLFLAAFYFVYRSFKEDNYKWDIIAGIFIGLAFLTRVIALALVFAVILLFLVNVFRRKVTLIGFINKVIMAIAFIAVISPWLVRNGLLYGFNLAGFLGMYASVEQGSLAFTTDAFMLFAYWFFVYSVYMLVASLALIPLLSLSIFNDKKIKTYFLLSVFTVIFVKIAAVNHNLYVLWDLFWPSKLMGRYVDVVFPIIIVNGFIGLNLLRKSRAFKYVLIFSIPFFIASVVLLFYQLFPVNNIMLSWLGFLRYAFEFIVYHKSTFDSVFNISTFMLFSIFFLLLPLIIILLMRKRLLTFRGVAFSYLILMLLVSLLAYGMVYYNSTRYWYHNPQTQLGLWINDYDKGRHSVMLFDSRDEGMIQKVGGKGIYESFPGNRSATIMGFWLNDDIVIGDALDPGNADYVVSKHKLDLELINSIDDIYLYKVKG